MHTFHRSLTRLSIAFLVITSVLLLIVWHLTTPASSGPVGILIVFLLMYLFFTAFILLMTGMWSLIRVKIFDRTRLDDRRRYYVSSVLGFLPVLYVTLLSMGGASIWGILLVVLFIGLMLFYVLRRSA